MRVAANAPIVALDIDGTLAEYYKHFHWFAELYTQRSLPVEFHRQYRGEFSEALSLDKELYRQIKLAYRQGGMKRSIEPKPYAGELVRGLRKAGIAVWICTTRPWNRLDNIDPDTNFWINRNLGRVDGVTYGEDKYQDLLEIVGSRPVLGVVDDLPENTLKARSLGLETILLSGAHNEYWTETGAEPHVEDNLVDVARHIHKHWIKNN
jgi:FMN phosphatase YigB (HAD superfamily)